MLQKYMKKSMALFLSFLMLLSLMAAALPFAKLPTGKAEGGGVGFTIKQTFPDTGLAAAVVDKLIDLGVLIPKPAENYILKSEDINNITHLYASRRNISSTEARAGPIESRIHI